MFNDRTDTFDRLVQFDLNAPLYLDGHPFRAIVNSEDYFYCLFSIIKRDQCQCRRLTEREYY